MYILIWLCIFVSSYLLKQKNLWLIGTGTYIKYDIWTEIILKPQCTNNGSWGCSNLRDKSWCFLWVEIIFELLIFQFWAQQKIWNHLKKLILQKKVEMDWSCTKEWGRRHIKDNIEIDTRKYNTINTFSKVLHYIIPKL